MVSIGSMHTIPVLTPYFKGELTFRISNRWHDSPKRCCLAHSLYLTNHYGWSWHLFLKRTVTSLTPCSYLTQALFWISCTYSPGHCTGLLQGGEFHHHETLLVHYEFLCCQRKAAKLDKKSWSKMRDKSLQTCAMHLFHCISSSLFIRQAQCQSLCTMTEYVTAT